MLSFLFCFSAVLVIHVVHADLVDHADHVDHADQGDAKVVNFAEASCIVTASAPGEMASNTIVPGPNVKVGHAV